jgi:secreted trypsin-like serine protease
MTTMIHFGQYKINPTSSNEASTARHNTIRRRRKRGIYLVTCRSFGTITDSCKEAMFADKDSGGPTFLDDGSENLLIAGIHLGLEVDGQTGKYGDIGLDARVSTYRDWIIDQNPEPATLMLIALGVPLVLKRKRH